MKALVSVLLLLVPVLAIDKALQTEYCVAPAYGMPGFHSSRDIYPLNNTLWDNVHKVAFQNADCTWLAGNFMDTGSDFVVVMFGGATTHKETWPLPDLARTLAQVHGFSSLAVDIAGRGESCGYEVGPDHTSEVRSWPSFSLVVHVRHGHEQRQNACAGSRHGSSRSLCQQLAGALLWGTFR